MLEGGGSTIPGWSGESSPLVCHIDCQWSDVRMAERSKALRSGRSLVLQAWVRIPLLTTFFGFVLFFANYSFVLTRSFSSNDRFSRVG